MEEIKTKILDIIKEKLEIREEIRPKDLKRYAKTLLYLKDATRSDDIYMDKMMEYMKEIYKPMEKKEDI